MDKNHILTLLAILVTAMCSCGMSGNMSNGSNADSTLCQFNNIKQEKMYQFLDKEGDTIFIDNKVSLFWPTVINGKPCPELQNSLLRALTDSAELNTVDLVIDALLKPDDDLESAPGTLKPVDAITGQGMNIYSSELMLRMQEMGDRLLTYHIHRYAYMGGAHGIYFNNFVSYDQETEKTIALSDIIADTTLLRNATLKSIKQAYDYDIDDLFMPENGLLPLPGDFYIEDNVLHVVYQVYEIASYAQGMIDAPIYPYMLKPEETKRLFTPYGLELMEYVTE